MSDETFQLRVLVIDDNVDNAEMLSALLALMGCTTAVAFSGEEGLVKAHAFHPQLVFVDLEMPDMGGCEVVKQLRVHHSNGAARFICLTGRSQAGDRKSCLDAGFDDFHTKPLMPGTLARAVAASCGAR